MAPAIRSHLTLLENSASLYAASPAFQLPRCDSQSGDVVDWEPISYAKFKQDIDLFARHWARVLREDGIPQRSIVGMWLSGMTYVDALHIYGLSRAGYIPQLFSVRLPNPTVILELLQRAKGRALIYDPSFSSILADCSVPCYQSICVSAADPRDETLPPIHAGATLDDTAFLFHTSGSTSGSPKLVPCSYGWLESAIAKSYHCSKPKVDGKRDVTVWMGSLAHIGQSFMALGAFQHGACIIQPTKIGFSSSELSWMVSRCGLTRLNQFATFLTIHIRNARLDPKLLGILRSMDEILYSGLPLPREDEEWAYQNGLKLKNLFGSTECGAMMLSIGGSGLRAPLLEPIPGTAYDFRPLAPEPVASESGHRSTRSQLLELVILAHSGDCPDPSLRAVDGHYHTGDLFDEVETGKYLFRGRNDDWIKSENSLRCDTKAIEDNVYATCAELISECIVVGTGRPSPVLFVEPTTDMSPAKLKREILRRTRLFHARRYLHERVTSPEMIVVVDKGVLPRTATKGNIRRKATEEAYRSTLDKIFGVA
ncbi:acetyl-CoA synthetase-like protein [Amylostereum chailletii]|nr:acetyl-CoA synthetase-like protein [Amylostereum chailletii]